MTELRYLGCLAAAWGSARKLPATADFWLTYAGLADTVRLDFYRWGLLCPAVSSSTHVSRQNPPRSISDGDP